MILQLFKLWQELAPDEVQICETVAEEYYARIHDFAIDFKEDSIDEANQAFVSFAIKKLLKNKNISYSVEYSSNTQEYSVMFDSRMYNFGRFSYDDYQEYFALLHAYTEYLKQLREDKRLVDHD